MKMIKMADNDFFIHKGQCFFWNFDVIGNPYSIYEPKEIVMKEKKTKQYNPIKKKESNDEKSLYQTPHVLTEQLLLRETFDFNIWDGFCGKGAIIDVIADHYNTSFVLEKVYENFSNIYASDLNTSFNKKYPIYLSNLSDNKKIKETEIEIKSTTQDFFEVEQGVYDNLITNPPWLIFSDAIKHAKKIIKNKIAMLLPIQFLTGKERYDILTDINFPLTKVYIFNRLLLFSSELREDEKINVGNIGVAWFVWENIKVEKVFPVIEFIDIDPYVARKSN